MGDNSDQVIIKLRDAFKLHKQLDMRRAKAINLTMSSTVEDVKNNIAPYFSTSNTENVHLWFHIGDDDVFAESNDAELSSFSFEAGSKIE
ncbi:hypothetical protein GGH91_003995, partial [Coemansia sp. RSA 2671]